MRDRSGDNDFVGVAVTREAEGGRAWELEAFLLSCRVIGRSVETALLAHVAAEARSAGARELRGRYVPTKKNAPAREFYPSHGFVLVSDDDDGATLWRLDLARARVESPGWVRLTASEGGKA